MAKSRKKSTQKNLFSGKEIPKGTITKDEIGTKTEHDPSSDDKRFGGLDIHELTAKIKALCDKYKGEYEPSEWNGTAYICVYHSDIGAILGIVEEVDALVKQHEFRAKTVIHHHVSDEFGFRYMVRLTVPGPLKISRFG